MSHWLFENKLLETPPENVFGFVYCITCIKNGKKYIGRKYFGTTRRVKVKGKKRRKVIRKDSNWREYTGSSKALLHDINNLGKEYFKFEILAFGKTKGEVNYIEENLHHRLHVSCDDTYYNDCIGPRRFASVRLGDDTKLFLNNFSW